MHLRFKKIIFFNASLFLLVSGVVWASSFGQGRFDEYKANWPQQKAYKLLSLGNQTPARVINYTIVDKKASQLVFAVPEECLPKNLKKGPIHPYQTVTLNASSFIIFKFLKFLFTCLGQSSVSCRSNSSQMSQKRRGAVCRELTPLNMNSDSSAQGKMSNYVLYNIATSESFAGL